MPTNKNESQGKREPEQRNASGSRSNESSDLKQREYRDGQGNIHHHTRTSREQQKKS